MARQPSRPDRWGEAVTKAQNANIPSIGKIIADEKLFKLTKAQLLEQLPPTTNPTEEGFRKAVAKEVLVRVVAKQMQATYEQHAKIVGEGLTAHKFALAGPADQQAADAQQFKAMQDALCVFIYDPRISAFLRANDPKALQQAREAIGLSDTLRKIEANDLGEMTPPNTDCPFCDSDSSEPCTHGENCSLCPSDKPYCPHGERSQSR